MVSSDLIISALAKDTHKFNAYIRLFLRCYPGAIKYKAEYLKWLYLENPCGNAVGFDAVVDDRVVAHYAIIPFPIVINGMNYMACWSLNTATHPNYQGRGLFIRLAELTYSMAKELGYVAVIGVANRNSTPGFVNKLNFKLLGQLKTRFGYFNKLSLLKKATSYRKWSENLLKWRISNPSAKYYYRHLDDHMAIYTHTYPLNTPVLLGYCDKNMNLPAAMNKLSLRSLYRPTFFISYNYNASGVYIALPNRLLPSPWNIIYRNLNGPSMTSDLNIGICGLDGDTF